MANWPESIPPRFRKPKAELMSACKEWVSTYDAILPLVITDGIICLTGARGTGKTQMAAALMMELVSRERGVVRYATARDVFRRIREAMTNEYDSEHKAIHEFIKPRFLVIDAYEERGDTPFEDRTLNEIVDKRYSYCLSTLIISNDTAAALMKQLGPSILSRIGETGAIFEAPWESFRSKKLRGGERLNVRTVRT